LRKQIAGALVASLVIGSTPVWAATETTSLTVNSTIEESAERQQFRDSIERATERVREGAPASATTSVVLSESGASGPELTSQERRDLDRRRAALRTDPVARGAGGIVMLLVGTAVSIGASIYLYNKFKTDSSPTPSLGRR
jgi:hypothetical protein